MAKSTGGFKNAKLGKNVYRQIKRRGSPPVPGRRQKPEKSNKPERITKP